MKTWYRLENKANSTPALFLYDEIGGFGISASDFLTDLMEVEGDSIDVHISSLGGEVFQGFAIYQALKDHPAAVNIYVDSIAASIASVIAMAGDKVVMGKNSQMMIHDGHVTMQGNAADLTRMVDQLNRASDNIASVYAERTGMDVEVWRDAMRAETWFNAEEAVAAGLADEVSKSAKKMRNVSELQIFNYAGRQFAPNPTILGQKSTEKKTEPYGDVEYADPGYQNDGKKRYPIDTEEHVRAAWSYINQSDNAKLYTAEQLSTIKGRIKSAAEKFGIQISDTINTESLIKAIKEGLRHG